MMGKLYAQLKLNLNLGQNESLNRIHTGIWTAEVEGDMLHTKYKNNKNVKFFSYSTILALDKYTEGEDTSGKFYVLKTDAGTLNLKSNGGFDFSENPELKSLLKKNGLKKTPKGLFLMMAVGGFDFNCVRLLKEENFDLDVNDIVGMASAKMNYAVLKEKIGLLNNLNSNERSLKTLLMMESLKIDNESVSNMTKHVGANDAKDLSKLAQWNSMKITDDYIAMLNEAGFSNPSFKDLIGAKSYKIDADYINQIKSKGYEDISLQNLISLFSMSITGDWIQKVNNEHGYKLPYNKLTSLKMGY